MARPTQPSILARRVKLTQLLTMRTNIDNLTVSDLVRWTNLPEPECVTELERERLRRAMR